MSGKTHTSHPESVDAQRPREARLPSWRLRL